MKKIPLLITVLLMTLAPSITYAGPSFSNSYQAALAKSKKLNKPLILIFSASWCPPCQQMKQMVYPSTEVKPYHDKFVWAYLDADLEKNRRAMFAYGVAGIPHIEFLTPEGKSMGHFAGAIPPTQFVGILNKVLKVSKQKSAAPSRGSGTRSGTRSGSGSKSRNQ